jgi:cytochrome c oxidase cbb3-type subunit I/II
MGVPYPEMTEEEIQRQYDEQAEQISESLKAPPSNIDAAPDTEIVALIAYLQQLGKSEPYTPGVASAANSDEQ